MAAFDRIDRVMLSKGYAVAVTKRTSEQGIGEIRATLEDGTVVDWAAFNDNAAIIMDYAAVAKAAIEQRLAKPRANLMYGHSAGARIGRAELHSASTPSAATGDRRILLDDSGDGLGGGDA